jgi:hypothetical protein
MHMSIYDYNIVTCTTVINTSDNFKNLWEVANTVCNGQKFRILFLHVVTAGVYAWTGTTGSGKAARRAATSAV